MVLDLNSVMLTLTSENTESYKIARMNFERKGERI